MKATKPTMKGGVIKRGRVWYAYYRDATGKLIGESSHSTVRDDAVALRESKNVARRNGTLVSDARRVTLKQLRQLAEDRYAADGHCAPKRLALAWNALEKGLPELAVNVTTEAVDRYERDRLQAGLSRSTVNTELAALRRAFNLAIERGRLATKPVIKTPNPQNARQGVVTADALAKICKHLPAWAADVARFLFLTGWRVNEALGLMWKANVDQRARVLRLEATATKAKVARTFPFDSIPQLEQLLTARRRASASAFVFTGDARERVDYKELRKAWRAACRKAKVGKFIMHDLRRSAASNFIAAGVDEGTIMKLCGWQTRSMFDRYHIVSEESKRAAVAKLAAALEAVTTTT